MATNEPEIQSGCYSDLFRQATGEMPFPFQVTFARDLPSLVHVPTGLGKTAMAVLGWLWRRRGAGEDVCAATPRRLIYCLPMRVLVEQTRDNAIKWIRQLREKGVLTEDVPVHILMGGEDAGDWETYPERDMILIGTQDMLLSRALNRGYAAGRTRWPMQFGLLHTDCLWVFDEIQLMGSGLATTTQLEAFRRQFAGEGAPKDNGCKSVWMSATLEPSWLETVDYKGFLPDEPPLTFDFKSEIASPRIDPKARQVLEARWNAKKPVSQASSMMGDHETLAKEIITKHAERRGLTLIVVNTVRRAQELHEAISKGRIDDSVSKLVLLHSRFRPSERKQKVNELLNPELCKDMICVSTQVVEAGVDVDATTLFTELAPWAPMVQRFGRGNRRGERNETAHVFWIGLPVNPTDRDRLALPYDTSQLEASAARLSELADVGIKSLPKVKLPHKHTHIIRRKDLIDLFDTTPDLAGNDIDIDRYVREIEETDVRVFWRRWDFTEGNEPPPNDKAWRQTGRDEMCPAPIGELREFATKGKGKWAVWRWDFTEGRWQRVEDKNAIYPGQTYLVHASAGGYDASHGWIGTKGSAAVTPIEPTKSVGLNDDAYDDDGLSKTDGWLTIAEHTDDVCRELDAIVKALALEAGEQAVLRVAARWHDWGKGHEVFQKVLPEGAPRADELWAKASGEWKRYRKVGRAHFRHELASALGVLRPDTPIGEEVDRDLVAYLIAAHHGKVRLSIRSLPNEARPTTDDAPPRRFARGVWDGDKLPRTDLGGGVVTPEATLSLEPMEIGLCEEALFAGQPSWQGRAIRLRDTLGPFRLAYLEALLRAADWRASAQASGAVSVPASEEAAHV